MPRLDEKAPRQSEAMVFGDSVMPEDEVTTDLTDSNRGFPLTFPLGMGKVYVLGETTSGAFGDLRDDYFDYPTAIPVLACENVSTVACGGDYTLVLKSDGAVFSFGGNKFGQLGRKTPNSTECCTPTRLEIPETIVQICAADYFGLALSRDGNAYLWGALQNDHNEQILGEEFGSKIIYDQPIIISSYKIKEIAAGSNHFLLLTNEGKVFSWGADKLQQIGRLYTEEVQRVENKAQVLGLRSVADTKKIKLDFHLVPACVHFPNLPKARVQHIFCSLFSSFFITSTGVAYVCGHNLVGELGIEPTNGVTLVSKPRESPMYGAYKWARLCGGFAHVIGLTTNGKVFTTGRNKFGELGTGLGKELKGQWNQILPDEKIVHVEASWKACFAINDKGQLFVWGKESIIDFGGCNVIYPTPTLCKGGPGSYLDLRVKVISAFTGHAVLLVDGTLDLEQIYSENLRLQCSRFKNHPPKTMSEEYLYRQMKLAPVHLIFQNEKVFRDACDLLQAIVERDRNLTDEVKDNMLDILSSELVGTAFRSNDTTTDTDESYSSNVMEESQLSAGVSRNPTHAAELNPFVAFCGAGSYGIFLQYLAMICDALVTIFKMSANSLEQIRKENSFMVMPTETPIEEWYEAYIDAVKGSCFNEKLKTNVEERILKVLGGTQVMGLVGCKAASQALKHLKILATSNWVSSKELYAKFNGQGNPLSDVDLTSYRSEVQKLFPKKDPFQVKIFPARYEAIVELLAPEISTRTTRSRNT